MDPARDLGRLLMLLGAVMVVTGAILYFGGRLPLRLGKLPGDIVHRGERTTFYFSDRHLPHPQRWFFFLFWLFNHFRR
jgi:hypothetical protein